MRKISLITIACILLSACATKKKPTAAETAAMPKPSGIASKIKPCIKKDGLFPLYQDTLTGNVFMLIKKEQLDKEYIYFSYTVDGVVAAGHFRGSFRDNKVFTIKRYFDKIEFVGPDLNLLDRFLWTRIYQNLPP